MVTKYYIGVCSVLQDDPFLYKHHHICVFTETSTIEIAKHVINHIPFIHFNKKFCRFYAHMIADMKQCLLSIFYVAS